MASACSFPSLSSKTLPAVPRARGPRDQRHCRVFFCECGRAVCLAGGVSVNHDSQERGRKKEPGLKV